MLLSRLTVLSTVRVHQLPAWETGSGAALPSFSVPSTSKGRLGIAFCRRSKCSVVAGMFRYGRFFNAAKSWLTAC